MNRLLLKLLSKIFFLTFFFTACNTAQPTIRINEDKVSAPEPTLSFTPTPPLEAHLNVPVSDGRRQMIIRSVSERSEVSHNSIFSEQSWEAGAQNKYLLVVGDHRGLNENTGGIGTVLFSWFGALNLPDDSSIESTGQGVKDQFCAECRALVVVEAGGDGNTTYLFEVPKSLESSTPIFKFQGYPPVALTRPDWMPTTYIPALKGITPPVWGPPTDLPAASRLTFARSGTNDQVTFWAVDGDGQNEFQFPIDPTSYGWAKYSPDGNRVLVLTQPTIGWMDLYLYNGNASVGYPLVEDAEWVQAEFSLDGRWIYFSVKPVGRDAAQLYRISVDGDGIQEVPVDEEILYYKPTASGDLAVVTTNIKAPLFLVIGGSTISDPDFNRSARHEGLSILKGSGPLSLSRVIDKDRLQVFPGERYWLVGENASQDQVVLLNVDNNGRTVLHANGSGKGCISPDDAWVFLNVLSSNTGSQRSQTYELISTSNPNERRELLAEVDNLSEFIACQFSADGQHLLLQAYVAINEDDSIPVLFFLDQTGQVLNRVEQVAVAYFSPDGGRVAYSVEQEGSYRLYLAAADGTGSQALGSGLLTEWTAAP